MPTPAAHVIGRETQLRSLRQLLSDARAGRGGAVFLVGDAGVGKSRLTAEAASEAFTAGIRVLRGRSSTTGPTVPFRPLTEALMSLLRGGDRIDEQALGPYRTVLGRLIPEWSVGPAENVSMVILGEAVLRLLIAAGRERGQLLILEDLHEADVETLAVVEYLVDNLRGTPVALLGTIRSEICGALDLADGARRRGSGTVLDVPALTRTQVLELLAALLGAEPAAVPEPVLDRLWEDCAGNPFLAEELLQSMVGGGALVQGPEGWRVVGDLPGDVPGTLAREFLRQIDRLGPQGLELMSAAAVLGRRFSLTVLQRMSGIDDRTLLSHLHAGLAAQLVNAEEPAPDWYAFRQRLTPAALLTQLTPERRASLARLGAQAVEQLHPGLPGEWCPLVAQLRLQAGQAAEAAQLYIQAGRRALDAGAIGSAVALLDLAQGLLDGPEHAMARTEALELLLPALAEAGDFARAAQLTTRLYELGGVGLDGARMATLHTRLAKVAHTAGRWADGNRQIAMARQALGSAPDDAELAPVDVVAAYLALDTPGADRTQLAEKLAGKAVEAADRHELHAVVCLGWELLATVARERDLDEARRMLERSLETAERHGLPLRRLYAMIRLGGNGWLAEGETAGLAAARDEALRLGAATLVHTVDGILALHAVLSGDLPGALRSAGDCLVVVRRLRQAPALRFAAMAEAAAAAHRADRAGMERSLSVFEAWDGAGSQEEVLTVGLARVFCALMEEERELATRELAVVARLELENPSTYYLSGRHGLGVLLRALSGEADRTELGAASDTAAGRMRWNRHFLEWADAVLCGREGRAEPARAAAARALREGTLYPGALHLALRLVAEPAYEDGWGEPVAWLRRADQYFHELGVVAVASACRSSLRGMGVQMHQRRTGTGLIPARLRAQGVTAREYEVFVVLAERLGNKDVADRLFISPRTVEKHIAALITKTGVANRAALCALSASLR